MTGISVCCEAGRPVVYQNGELMPQMSADSPRKCCDGGASTCVEECIESPERNEAECEVPASKGWALGFQMPKNIVSSAHSHTHNSKLLSPFMPKNSMLSARSQPNASLLILVAVVGGIIGGAAVVGGFHVLKRSGRGGEGYSEFLA